MVASRKILVVDDEPNLRRTLMIILQRAGYQVTTVSRGREALQILKTTSFDVVFLDIRMPDEDGMSILPQIRRINPDIPVLILTAHATMETAIQAVRDGARDYLLKPVDPERILARVSEIMEEQAEPARRRQIVSQITNLISELQGIDNLDLPISQVVKDEVEADPTRYLRGGPLLLDLHTRHIRLDDRMISLPPSTFDVLVTLARHSPEPVSYEKLLQESLGYSLSRGEAREMARWQVHELRKALEPDQHNPRYIITVRDVGYRLVA